MPRWVGHIKRLSIEQKNLDTLLRAFRQLRDDGEDVELHFYGDGPDRATLEARTETLDLAGTVAFHGRYDHRTDLPGIMANTHVFTYTSNYEGGPCFSLLELLQAGRYVVGAPVGGIPDIYEGHPEVGLLVGPGNLEAIAAALRGAIHKVASGAVDPATIRARYRAAFDMAAAHAGWTSALSIRTDVQTVHA